MKLIQWTLFIDMLGYGQINGTIDSDEQAEEFIKFMNKNVEIFKLQDSDEMWNGYKESNFDVYEYYEIQHALISDSLFITYKPKEVDKNISEKLYYLHSANALFIIMHRLQHYLYHCLEEKKIFIRGGISNKYARIEGNFAVGTGVIEAYVAESQIAKQPRIVLCEDVVENKKLIDCISLISNTLYRLPSVISKDGDVVYLDYLSFMIRNGLQGGLDGKRIAMYHNFFLNHKNSICHHRDSTVEKISQLKKQGDIAGASKIEKGVLSKYDWLVKYHNESIRTFQDDKIERQYIIK